MNHLRAGLRCVPFLVPVLYAGLILWLQPADYLGVSDKAPWLNRLVYDDYDLTAYALRGLNAHLGRTGGLVRDYHYLPDEEFAQALDSPNQTLQPGYYLEYPHPCLLLFRLGYVWQSDFVEPPPPVCDAPYGRLVQFYPRNNAQRQIWGQLRKAVQTHVVLMAVCLVALMAVLRFGYEPGRPAIIWPLLLPAMLYFALNRFDVVPVFLTALSLACLGRRRVAAAAFFLAAATAVKLYPVVLVPLFLAYVARERRALAVWTAAYGGTLAVLLLPTLLLSGWDAFWGPYHVQLSRGPMGPTIYGSLLPTSWAESSPWTTAFRAGILLGTVALLCLGRMRGLDSLLRRSAIVLIVFGTLAVFYSPQWVLWFAPLLLPLATTRRRLLVPVVALDLLTYLTFPVGMDGNLPDSWGWFGPGWFVVLRFVFLALLMGMLAWDEFRPAAGGAVRGAPAPLRAV
jgi:hypothetical protein